MQTIMFVDKFALTKAVLEGRKTQTRRIIKRTEHNTDFLDILSRGDYLQKYGAPSYDAATASFRIGTGHDCCHLLPHYALGEEVAVAQCYNDCPDHARIAGQLGCAVGSGAGWRSKMFVKAHLMPHRIKITGVRIERLQQITAPDCMAEGIVTTKLSGDKLYYQAPGTGSSRVTFSHSSPVDAYAMMIDRISGPGTWKSNPLVLVYDFELIK